MSADRFELPGLALIFPVVASGHQLVDDLLTGWRGSRERLRNLRSVMGTLRPSGGAGPGQIDVGGVGSCWHDRLLSLSLRNTF